MLKKIREKLTQLEELEILQRENKELQENVNDLVDLNISVSRERDKLQDTIDNLKKERAALIEQIQMMRTKLAPRASVKDRFDELKIDFDWD